MSEIKDIPKRPLGRGLGSLLGDDLIDEFKSTLPGSPAAPVHVAPEIDEQKRIWDIEIEKIVPNTLQPRKMFLSEKIEELAASIREKGILQPITARKLGKDQFEIIAGERRWRAAQLAGLQRVPVILKDVVDQESLELALIENLQRHNLNAIEEAEAYQNLVEEFSLSQQEIATKVGKDRVTVTNSLRLLNLAPEVKAMVSRGEISAGHAKALLALTDVVKQKEIAKKINSEKLTVRAAEKLIHAANRRRLSENSSLEVDVAGKLVSGLQHDLTKTLGTKVDISYNRGKGNITIKFYSDEDLTRIIDRIKS